MAKKRRRFKGISIGTILTLALVVVTIAVGASIFARISGDIGEISLDPKVLTEPLAQFSQIVVDPDALGVEGKPGTAPEMPTLPEESEPATPEPTPTPEPTQPPVRSVSINAVGLVALGNELRVSGRDAASGTYDYAPLIAPMGAALSGADLSIATLRTSMGNAAGSYDAYRAPVELIQALKANGINLCNFATDRLLDHGMQGVSETLEVLGSEGMSTSGVYRSLEDRQAAQIHDLNGVKVGVYSFATGISAAGKKAVSATELSVATRVYDAEAVKTDLAAMRSQGADLIVVLANWGSRSDKGPSPATKEIVDALAGAGADIILGTNPSSVHELERRMVSDPDGSTREVIIAYSLGNFLMDDSRDTPAITGVVLHLGIEWDAQAKRATYVDNWYMPTWIMRWKDASGVSRYRVVPSGVSSKPADMLDSIYTNMGKTYDNMATKLGDTVAKPRKEP